MKPEIKTLAVKKLIGKKLPMSFASNRTVELWRNFMPRRKEIKNSVGSELFSLQIYGASYFSNFNPNSEFVKWACVEVADFDFIPEEMESFELSGGLYAVFHYTGSSANAREVFQYIFGIWLPESEYELDDRPHFELLDDKYKNDDPNSEEDIWVPVKRK